MLAGLQDDVGQLVKEMDSGVMDGSDVSGEHDEKVRLLVPAGLPFLHACKC